MGFATLYIHAQSRAFECFTGFTRSDLVVLDQLQLLNKPMRYCALLASIHLDYYNISTRVFQMALNKLVKEGLINRDISGNNVLYSITLKGSIELYEFSLVLDSIVKQQVNKYGNGL